MAVDIDAVGAAIRQAAAEAAIPHFRNLVTGEVREKGPGDLVTVADLAVERLLTGELTRLLPGSLVVGEEGVDADPGILHRLDGEDPVWVVDPIDGTANFAAGIPLFAVMVALCQGGETRAGWIYDPVGGRLAVAEAGGGARLLVAGETTALHVAAPAAPVRMSGCISFRYGDRALAGRMAERSNRVGTLLNLRCAGHEYLTLVEGRIHFSLYHRTLPWDHAAGVLIHREAGGYSSLLDGTPYRARNPGHSLLTAPDRDSWQALRETLVGESGM